MAAIQINLAEELQTRLKARAQENGFTDAADYVQAMVVADLGGPGMDDGQLEKLLLERLDGPFVEMDENDLGRIREKFVNRMSKNKDGASE